MRRWCIRYAFYFSDIKNAKIGLPTIKAESDLIDKIVLVNDVSDFKQIINAEEYIKRDSPSRAITVKENEFFIARNTANNHVLIRVRNVKCKGRGGETQDEVKISWVINPDSKTKFS